MRTSAPMRKVAISPFLMRLRTAPVEQPQRMARVSTVKGGGTEKLALLATPHLRHTLKRGHKALYE